MKNSSSKKTGGKKETMAGVKAQPAKNNPVQKGYNEKNPGQPEGAFKPANRQK